MPQVRFAPRKEQGTQEDNGIDRFLEFPARAGAFVRKAANAILVFIAWGIFTPFLCVGLVVGLVRLAINLWS